MSSKRTECSNLTVAMQKKKCWNYVASVTDDDIPYMERPAIKGKTTKKKEKLTIKEAANHFFFACGYWYDLMLCKKIVLFS